MSAREYQHQNVSGAPNDGLLSPLDKPRGQPPHRVTSSPASWRAALPFHLPGFATKFAPDPKILSPT